MQHRSTIFALSSGHGRAGIAVVRVSGPAARSALEAMAPPCPRPRRAALRRVRHPHTGEILDEALVLYFAGPASETGEDMAELHLHGSPAVVRATLAALGTIAGCRLAEPGEFARRAFEHGKIDLTAAEGLADLIAADTDAQRRQALAQAGGAFARTCQGWRTRLVEAQALLEATIDFADEADVTAPASSEVRAIARTLHDEIAAHLDDANRGEIVRDGFRIVLAGAPNAGKSSLLNVLARRDVAIVSPEAGTTRDVIEAHLDLAGFAVIVTDTAGIREATGAVEREGMRRTLERARTADLVLWLVDAAAPAWQPPPALLDSDVPRLTVLNKIDLLAPGPEPAHRDADAHISAATGAGLPGLLARIEQVVATRLAARPGMSPVTQARHRHALEDCRATLARYLADPDAAAELAAEDLRLAAESLGRITGHVDPEEILDLIFGRFCIGK